MTYIDGQLTHQQHCLIDGYNHKMYQVYKHYSAPSFEIDELTDTTVSYYCGKWTYEYELGEYPLDTDLHLYSWKHNK